MSDPRTTHFGFETVEVDRKAQRVRSVFDSVAEHYDLMNDLMSFGLHRGWKRFAIGACGLREGMRLLDLAGGTGDLAARAHPLLGRTGEIVLADINASMLARGRDRLLDEGRSTRVRYVQVDAESLPFADAAFDCVVIGFGLRNVTRKEKALASMLRVLRRGGRLVVLEFSTAAPALRPLYDAYSFRVLPALGDRVAGDAASYRYLAESIRMHPSQDALRRMMEAAGFERCTYFNLAGGVVAVHRGYRLC